MVSMSYPFVQAKWFTPGGMKEPRAIVLHMAEGGGTVDWLTHPPNDNSSHFVVEYSGRVVQMVRDGDADHSLHWDTANWSASTCGGTFASAVARRLLGDGVDDPNAHLFAVECEGTAAAGPNDKQRVSLRALIADLVNRHPTLRGLLGHRDFQGYKACPGCHVFDTFKHGEWEMAQLPITVEDDRKQVTQAKGGKWYDLDGTTVVGQAAGDLDWRTSPYGVGTKRAIYATVDGKRNVVLITPSKIKTNTTAIRDIPARTVTLEVDGTEKAKVVV